MRRLNNQDTLLVYGEATGWRLHIASLQVYRATDAPVRLDLEQVRALYRQRLADLPVFRVRLVRVPGGAGRPVWVENPDTDVADHIHGIRLPEPGTDRQLATLVGELFARPIDLDRAPWDVWVIEGLEGGGVAVLPRVNHGAVDGTRGLELEAATLDLDPAAPPTHPAIASGPGGPAPGPLSLLGGAALGLATTPLRMARTATHLVRATGRLAGVLARGESSGLALPMAAPRTSLNQAVSTRRAFAFCSLPLAPVEYAAKQEGVTVNDVVLALTAGALRRYLADRGELPRRPLVAAMPVGLPLDEVAPNAGGNRWAVTTVGLATDITDPTERLRAIAISARAGKAVQRAIGPDLWQDLVDLPPAMIGWIARGYAGLRLVDRHPPLVNVVVSNLRGSPLPVYCAGTRVDANYPIGPVADGLGLNLTVVSYRDALDVGLSVCPDLVEDPWLLADALRVESDELADRYPADPAAQHSAG